MTCHFLGAPRQMYCKCLNLNMLKLKHSVNHFVYRVPSLPLHFCFGLAVMF